MKEIKNSGNVQNVQAQNISNSKIEQNIGTNNENGFVKLVSAVIAFFKKIFGG